MKKLIILNVCLACMISAVKAQEKMAMKATVVAWDGMIVGGYVDKGGFVNFGGPSIKLIRKPLSFVLGVLPTLRIKEDNVAKDAPKNSVVTPTLGFGLSVAYKHLVLQVPFYYNPKTAAKSGKWNPGIGIGFKF